ncbi:MAG: YhdH/YhfP family quinone oxidoreductase [Alcanivoracaceae bacterium]|nr:YhdH/YhfP family quinone oxidoreductase [Alcanivoracaceae bacterium]
MTSFRALQAREGDNGYETSLVTRQVDELPEGDVLVRVHWSSLNYKDALSASGNKGVTRRYPHTPGIDVAGVVVQANSGPWNVGDKVIITGFDLGMNTAGGFAEYVRVPAEWLVRCPLGLTLREAMLYGTAGLTAALCVSSLVDAGLPDDGDVLVTGASGGVGSVACALLAQLGYRVVAVSGKADARDWLEQLGVAETISRDDLLEGSQKPMMVPRWSGVVDTVGGAPLAAAVKGLQYGASAACCGMVAGAELPLNVFPFILRGVNLLGVDSVELPVEFKQQMWDLLGSDWYVQALPQLLAAEVSLEQLPDWFARILAGQVRGRVLVKVCGDD